MNGYMDLLTSNIENNRNCLRRIARHDEAEFSNQSILCAMEKFVKSVNAMDETILVPCRLMDLKVGDAQDTTETSTSAASSSSSNRNNNSVKDSLSSTDLFDLFNMLNSVKVDLLWGQNHGIEMFTPGPTDKSTTTTTLNVSSPVTQIKGHVRRSSTVSVTSTNSVASVISDSESEVGNENDSGIEDSSTENTNVGNVAVARNFRRHLSGLYHSLQQLTNAANYLTSRYQHDVGTTV